MPGHYARFGRSAGNLGNQMMQWMSMIGMSKRLDVQFFVPTWKYAQYFSIPPNQLDQMPEFDHEIEEPSFNFHTKFWEQYHAEFKEQNVNIFGWLQSSLYYYHCREDVRKATTFAPWFQNQMMSRFGRLLKDRPTIAITVRVGDYVGNPNYEWLPATYYIQALRENFEYEHYQLLIFSDDIDFCKIHFECLPNAWFADGMSDIELLWLLSKCENFIIGNSTFSIVGAELACLNGCSGRIIRPVHTFAGPLLKTHDSSDLYPLSWKKHNHLTTKINLRDVTFTIPVMYDHRDRKENLDLCLKFLSAFDTNIIVGEQGQGDTYRFEYVAQMPGVRYMQFRGDLFHRTKMLNDMAIEVKTEIVANWDADILVPPMQIIKAVERLKEGADFVYPYDGRFARVGRQQWYKWMDTHVDVGLFGGTLFKGTQPGETPSVGGAIMYRMEAFADAGMENEHMVSYAPEDHERWGRFNKLGFKVERIPGRLFHIDHAITLNSSVDHPHYAKNMDEWYKVQNMGKDELQAYVRTWGWTKRYSPLYYESLVEESVKSRDTIFKVLSMYFQDGMFFPSMKIIDMGCGLGSWGHQLDEAGYEYTGVDYGVPAEKLVIRPDQYIDHDLRLPFKSEKKYDLVLCMEVIEHLEPEFTDVLIDSLCALSDTIIFSGAIPHQGGRHHYSEKWQSHWAQKFFERGFFRTIDVRRDLYSDPNVSLWFKQNIMVFTTDTSRPIAYDRADFIHPEMFENILRHHKIIK